MDQPAVEAVARDVVEHAFDLNPAEPAPRQATRDLDAISEAQALDLGALLPLGAHGVVLRARFSAKVGAALVPPMFEAEIASELASLVCVDAALGDRVVQADVVEDRCAEHDLAVEVGVVLLG